MIGMKIAENTPPQMYSQNITTPFRQQALQTTPYNMEHGLGMMGWFYTAINKYHIHSKAAQQA